MLLADVIVEVIVHRTAPEGEGDEDEEGEQEHRHPGAVVKQASDVFLEGGLLAGRRFDALLDAQKGDDEKDNAEQGEDADALRPSLLGAPPAQRGHHEQQKALDQDSGALGEDEAPRGEARPLIDIPRHHPVKGRIGGVVHRVDGHEQDVGDIGVDEFAVGRKVGGGEGQPEEYGEGDGGPEQPGPELAPARVGPVCDRAHDGIKDGIPEAADQEQGAGGCGGDAKNVGVKADLEHDHDLKYKVRRGIGKAVADLFSQRQSVDLFLIHA
ncbi:MAG: hypothetical protein BWY77_01496 [bacterium ADurb.Bin431]|nr:MAG: hypothetical protein BWY77_01496 [bacterium ADurb.Bin431]